MAGLVSVATLAQFSSLLPILWMMLWSFLRGDYTEEGQHRQERSIAINSVRQRRRKISILKDRLAWWLQDEGFPGWGTTAEWIFGIFWTIWLGVLAAHSSDRVYIRLVRHLGVMAVSQLPTCTLLAMKSSWSPFQAFLKLSHEELDPYHRILGRIVIILATLHGALYLQFFVAHHIIPEPSKAYVVLVGLTAVCALWILGIFTLATIRRKNYRLFYGFHHAMFIVIMFCLFIHVAVARPFVLESLFIYVLNQVLRSTNTTLLPAELSMNTDSNVLSISIALPSDSKQYPAGSSVQLSTKSRRWAQKLCSGFVSNPFTTTFERENGILAAHLKTRGKRTHTLAKLPTQTVVSIEGPYGRAARFESSIPEYLISNTDRVLLVAGGVGATFTFSIAQALLDRIQYNRLENVRKFLKVVWVVRNKDDIAWANSLLQKGSKESGKAVLANVTTLYFSQPSWRDANPEDEPDLSDLVEDGHEDQPLSSSEKIVPSSEYSGVGKPQFGRPPLKEIVEDFLGDMTIERTAAVAVCGPGSLGRDLRQAVGYHVRKGTKIWWHEEKFGQ